MNAKDITIKTISENGAIIGKSIKGKGLEIFNIDTRVMTAKSSAYSSYIDEDKAKLLALKEREDFDELYVCQYRHLEEYYSPCTFETQHILLDEFISEYLKSPESFTSFHVNKKPQKIGHISLSKYNSSKQSQIKLCQDLLGLSGISIYGEVFEDNWDMQYDDSIKKFEESNSKGKYYDGDYYLEHGDKWCEPKGNCIYFDGRMKNCNDSVMEFFEFDEGEYLKELDPEKIISVYHRKGKDWYTGYSINQQEIYVYYKDENSTYEKNECEDDICYLYTYVENKELLEEVNKFLKDTKEDLEIRCYIGNELDEDCEYRDCSVDFKAVELCYDEIDGLKEEISDNISWNYETLPSEFINAYNKALNEKFTVLENFKVQVEESSKYKESTFTTYNHLAILKKLEKRYNYELVKSAVSDTISTVSWAIKQENEEFHFNLASLIVYDLEGEHSLSEFLSDALTALNKRRLEKIKEAELYAKASKVFVGIKDSLSSGNCEFGTNAFISKHHINTKTIGGIRGDVLLEMEKSNFTLRAVAYAITKHHVA